MKSLNFEPRILRLFYFFFVLNLCLSILKGYPSQEYTGFYWFVNLILPVWFSISLGSVIGLIIFIFPQPVNDAFQKMLRSMVLGTMIVTFAVFVFYLYDIMLFLLTPQ